MSFKVGDWVRSKSFENDGNEELLIKKLKVQQQVDFVHKYQEEWELWQPKQGEWCWFWYLNCSAVLAQCSGYDGEDYEAIEYSNSINGKRIERVSLYSYCEPFIGNLPSFIKE